MFSKYNSELGLEIVLPLCYILETNVLSTHSIYLIVLETCFSADRSCIRAKVSRVLMKFQNVYRQLDIYIKKLIPVRKMLDI